GSPTSNPTAFTVTGGLDLTSNCCCADDAFVAKVNAAGTALVYAGYIGGAGRDRAFGIAVDAAGNAYVTGGTNSDQTTFPVTGGPDLTYNGGLNTDPSASVVAKVNPDGTAVGYAGHNRRSGN